MRQIYHAETTTVERYVLDPTLGPIKRREEALKPSGTWRIGAPDGATFERGADGTFEVPDEVAAFWLRRPGWHEGASPFAAEAAASRGDSPAMAAVERLQTKAESEDKGRRSA